MAQPGGVAQQVEVACRHGHSGGGQLQLAAIRGAGDHHAAQRLAHHFQRAGVHPANRRGVLQADCGTGAMDRRHAVDRRGGAGRGQGRSGASDGAALRAGRSHHARGRVSVGDLHLGAAAAAPGPGADDFAGRADDLGCAVHPAFHAGRTLDRRSDDSLGRPGLAGAGLCGGVAVAAGLLVLGQRGGQGRGADSVLLRQSGALVRRAAELVVSGRNHPLVSPVGGFVDLRRDSRRPQRAPAAGAAGAGIVKSFTQSAALHRSPGMGRCGGLPAQGKVQQA